MTSSNSPEPAPFAATLRAVRGRTGLSQAEVAKRAGLTASYLSMLESRRKPPPSDPVVKRLARALDLDPAFLLEIAHLERTPEDIRQRMAGLRSSLEAEKTVTKKVLRGPLLEVLWHFLAWRGFTDASLETLRLSRRTHRLVRSLARDAGKTSSPEAFRERTSRKIEALDPEARDELIEAMPGLTRRPEIPDEPPTSGGAPIRENLDGPDDRKGDERMAVPSGLRIPGAYWFRVADQDMYPRIQTGDLLLMAPDRAPSNGDLVAVVLHGRDTVRVYMDLPDGPELTAMNTSLPPARPGPDVRIVAVARWLSRPLGGRE